MKNQVIQVVKNDTSISFKVEGQVVANCYPINNKGKIDHFSILIQGKDISLDEPQSLNTHLNMLNLINTFVQKINRKYRNKSLLLLADAEIDTTLDFY